MNKFRNKVSWKRNLSKALTGRKMSVEWRQNMSAAAHRRWNKPEERERIRKAKTGKELTSQHRQNISASVKKMWDARKLSGYQHPVESKERMAESVRANVEKAIASGTFVRGLQKNCRRHRSPFEKEICRCLRKLHIRYRTQIALNKRYVADILLLDHQVILECDGYHHTLPTVIAKDRRRDCELRQSGFKTIRIKEATFKKQHLEATQWALRRARIKF